MSHLGCHKDPLPTHLLYHIDTASESMFTSSSPPTPLTLPPPPALSVCLPRGDISDPPSSPSALSLSATGSGVAEVDGVASNLKKGSVFLLPANLRLHLEAGASSLHLHGGVV